MIRAARDPKAEIIGEEGDQPQKLRTKSQSSRSLQMIQSDHERLKPLQMLQVTRRRLGKIALGSLGAIGIGRRGSGAR